MNKGASASSVNRWTLFLFGVMAMGMAATIARLYFGLAATTHLTNLYPWGIWVAVNIDGGVALAAGGFAVVALVHVVGRRQFAPFVRPALFIAWLGYVFAVLGLVLDLGRYGNIWHPVVYWQGNSVLFEIAICVMLYLTVLTVEVAPTVLYGVSAASAANTRLHCALMGLQRFFRRTMPFWVLLGITLSFLHQASLGTLLVIAPSKVHPLWFTPLLPLNFLLSAVAAGFSTVVLVVYGMQRAAGEMVDLPRLSLLGRYAAIAATLYGLVRLFDLLWSERIVAFTGNWLEAVLFGVEILLGILLPVLLLLMPAARNRAEVLVLGTSLVALGVILNRINVFWVAFRPLNASTRYWPSIAELLIMMGMIAAVVFFLRLLVQYFPILVKSGSVVFFNRRTMVVGVVIYIVVGAMAAGYFLARGGAPLRDVPRVNKTVNVSLADKVSKASSIFSHLSHVARLQNDCAQCHHRIALDPNDAKGQAVDRESLLSMRVENCSECHGLSVRRVLKVHGPNVGACAGCHHSLVADGGGLRVMPLTDIVVGDCDACHTEQKTVLSVPSRVKALHQQCIGCHRARRAFETPGNCVNCHIPMRASKSGTYYDDCGDCHGEVSHAGLFGVHLDVHAKQMDCVDCHPKIEKVALKLDNAAAKVKARPAGHPAFAALGCVDCHDEHGEELDCGKCHAKLNSIRTYD